MTLHDLKGTQRVACSHGVAQSLTDHALALIPGAGSQMQGRHRFAGTKALLQHGAKEMVIAEPTSFLVKGHDKKVANVEVAQGFAAALGLHDGITKLWTHGPQYRRPQQECLNVFWQALQHFFEQVVLHQPMAAGEQDQYLTPRAQPRQRDGWHLP